MRSQPPPQQRTLALPRSSGNSSGKYFFAPGGGYSHYVRAELSTSFFDNHDAAIRTCMFTNRPRTIAISEQGSF